MAIPTHSYRAYIGCDITSAWDAIVNGNKTVSYYYGTRVESDWQVDSRVKYLSPNNSIVADGIIISIEPPSHLEMMFHARWDPDLDAEGPVRMVWTVEDSGGIALVTVQSFLDTDTKSYTDWVSGIPFIVSGMKTLLETGKPLTAS